MTNGIKDFEDVKILILHKGNIFGGLVCYIRAIYYRIGGLEKKESGVSINTIIYYRIGGLESS